MEGQIAHRPIWTNFEFPKGNVWLGICVVLAFQQDRGFVATEFRMCPRVHQNYV